MSESGDERRGPRQGRRRNQNSQSDEKELATQLVTIQSKRFYIDVKENQRGRFIKLVELAQGGRRNRVLMSMNVANEFKQKLLEFSELNSSLGPAAQQPANENKDQQSKKSRDNQNEGLIKSETLVKDNKRYYFDLRENQRGRFLRVSQVIQRGPRNVIGKVFYNFNFLRKDRLANFESNLKITKNFKFNL